MNRKLQLILVLGVGTAGLLSGANGSKIVTSDGREIKTSKIEIRNNGDLEYLSADGNIFTP